MSAGPVPEPASPPRQGFVFLDGARALAALTVAVFHASLFTGRTEDHEQLPAVLAPLGLGQFAVAVFIVLSGFVLMLPVARRPGLDLKDGVWGFLRRRARRLLPPYYASLAIFIMAIALVPALQEESGTAWDSKVPVTPGGIASHLLVVHNLFASWRVQINGPAWSVATEWQIYLAMAFVLLPVWRRGGPWVALAVAVGGSWALHAVLPRFDNAHLWYVADFTLGMIAAKLVVDRRPLPGLGAVTAAAVGVCVAVGLIAPDLVNGSKWLSEVLFGVVVAAGILWMGQRTIAGRPTPLHRVLESRLLVWLGLWSYSFYLLHSPLLGFANLALLGVPLSTGVRFAVMALLVLPLTGVISYAFHLLVERRFMTSHQLVVTPAVTPEVPAAVAAPPAEHGAPAVARHAGASRPESPGS